GGVGESGGAFFAARPSRIWCVIGLGRVGACEGQRRFAPLPHAATLALTRLHARVEQALLDVVAVTSRTRHEQLLERNPHRTRSDQTAQDGLMPSVPIEVEALLALADAVAFFV